ncbi:oligosaccharide flippase family protein [Vicingaceae bacterium]|nr:oligosaccharide flippase family protein [Vicingaceae bacterium]
MLKKLFSHSFLYAIGPQVPKLANILVLPIITQFLTAEDYGIYGTLLAYSGLLGGLKTMGVEVLLINSFFKKSNWIEYWGRYFMGLSIYSIIFSVIYISVLYLFMPKEVGSNLWIVIGLIVIPATLFNIVNVFGSRYFQLVQKPKYIAIITAVVAIFTILLNLYTIAHLKLGYLGWFISSALGAALSFLLYFYPLFKQINLKPILTLNKNFWKKSLRVSLPTIPHNYSAYLLNSSDRLVMDQLKTPIDQIGIYNLTAIFGGYIEFFGNAVGMAVGPYITGLYAKKNEESEKQVKTLVYLLQVGFIFICAFVSLWAKELFDILIRKEELSAAYPISIIIIMGYAYRPLYWVSVNKLIFYEKTNQLWKISFVAGILNVGLNFIFIPLYGVYAAAVTTLFSLVYLGLAPFYIKEYRSLGNQKYHQILWMVVIILFTVLLFMLKDLAVIYKAFLSLLFLIILISYFLSERKKLSQINI